MPENKRYLTLLATSALSMAKRIYPMPEARGCGREEQPHLQGVVAAKAQEGL